MASAFGLFVLAAIWGMRYLRQEKVQFQTVSSAYIITAVSLFLLGLFEHLSFHEPPPRQGDGNFTWALYSTMPYSLPMIGLFYNALKSVKLKHIVTLALLLHLTSGAVYAVTYLQYGKIVPDGDNSGELSSLRKRLNHNARGFAFNHDTTTIEAYLGVPCFNRGEQCEDYPDHYSDLCESTASLESNLKKINPDFIVLNRNSIDADKFPNTLFSGYFLLNSSKYGREIWLRQDYAKNSCE